MDEVQPIEVPDIAANCRVKQVALGSSEHGRNGQG
jgi:hypothetical protein